MTLLPSYHSHEHFFAIRLATNVNYLAFSFAAVCFGCTLPLHSCSISVMWKYFTHASHKTDQQKFSSNFNAFLISLQCTFKWKLAEEIIQSSIQADFVKYTVYKLTKLSRKGSVSITVKSSIIITHGNLPPACSSHTWITEHHQWSQSYSQQMQRTLRTIEQKRQYAKLQSVHLELELCSSVCLSDLN